MKTLLTSVIIIMFLSLSLTLQGCDNPQQAVQFVSDDDDDFDIDFHGKKRYKKDHYGNTYKSSGPYKSPVYRSSSSSSTSSKPSSGKRK